jgi:hypothetical protein
MMTGFPRSGKPRASAGARVHDPDQFLAAARREVSIGYAKAPVDYETKCSVIEELGIGAQSHDGQQECGRLVTKTAD